MVMTDICEADLPKSSNPEVTASLASERTSCTHCQHGDLVRYLRSYGYWPPITQATMITESVEQVVEKLTTLKSIRFRNMSLTLLEDIEAAVAAGRRPTDYLGSIHARGDVGRKLAGEIIAARDAMEDPISQVTRDEIRVNARKTGLDADVPET